MPGEEERRRLPRRLVRPIAKLRTATETTVMQLAEQLDLACHEARSFLGVLGSHSSYHPRPHHHQPPPRLIRAMRLRNRRSPTPFKGLLQ